MMSGNSYDPNAPSPTPAPPPPEPRPLPPLPNPSPAPAPQPRVSVNIEQVKYTIDLILKIADSATHMIPGDMDDKILGMLKGLAAEPWFAEVVVLLLSMTGAQRQEAIRGMAQKFGVNT